MARVARRARSRRSINTLALRRVDVYLQKSAQRPSSGTARGIDQLDWRVTSGGRRLASGKTGADGRIRVPILAGQPSRLELQVSGRTVATYTVTERRTAAEAASTVRGRQRRLNSMGYQLGSPPVDGTLGRRTDRGILDYQGDEGINITGVINATVQTRLTGDAGY